MYPFLHTGMYRVKLVVYTIITITDTISTSCYIYREPIDQSNIVSSPKAATELKSCSVNEFVNLTQALHKV